MRKIKIGIDVGGTFTHAVAIDIADYSIVGKSFLPTTHNAKEGVAKGVVESLLNLINRDKIDPDEIILIAHSTTQATNALLEGDVAVVGVIGMGKGLEGKIAKNQSNPNDIELSSGKYLQTKFRYIDVGRKDWKKQIPFFIDELINEGSQVIVASESFGVDNPANEEFVADEAQKKNLLASAASNISKLYGLKVRTRTAVINASMMPKMLETANMTEKAIRLSGINAPLMVMRSDGGIMDINEMRKRPILTLLSGPAAGVAAALMYIKISDGIFLEVGGTSTDISVIKNGKPQIKTAQIGKNRLYLRTLDVRTIGIAGGSIPHINNNKIFDVGPRSAHIANLNYVAFSNNQDYSNLEIKKIQPMQNDCSDYLSINLKNNIEKKFAITPTEASYKLNLVKENEYSKVNLKGIESCFNELSKILNDEPNNIASNILKLSADKISPVIKQLTREYKLEKDFIQMIGGGGGASAIVPFTADSLKFPHLISENCEITSAIGAALGIIRDSIERNIINPTENDIIKIRQEAINSVLKMGANPNSVEAVIEIDNQNKKVIATAFGSSELRTKELGAKELNENDLLNICANSFKNDSSNLFVSGKTSFLFAITFKKKSKYFFNLFGKEINKLKVIDIEGIIKLQLNNCIVSQIKIDDAKNTISNILAKYTTYGDAGALLPDIYLLIGRKIIDFTGLILESQILSLLDIETKNILPTEDAVVIASQKK